MSDRDICDFHGIMNVECGGPHRVVPTELGDEVLAPSQEPIGTPLEDK
jgi:hypothetical protein